MGTIASANPGSNNSNNGLADLLQTLTSENSPLLSTLSSSKVQQALENAPASDIVEISEQAQQLQSVDALFGISNPAATPTESLFSSPAAESSGGSGSQPPSQSLFDVFG